MNKGFTSKLEPKGIVTRRLYSGETLKTLLEEKCHVNLASAYDEKGVLNFNVLCMMALDLGLTKEELGKLIEQSVKKQFSGNSLWKLIRKHFNKDLVIPFVTGYYTTKAVKGNLIVSKGHKIYADLVGGTNSQGAVTAMAYGTGTTAAAAGDTALQTEVSRAASTIANTTTSTTGDTASFSHTFTAGGTQAITEEGLLDNNTSGGNMLAHQVFSAVNMVLNDTIAFTHKLQS